MRTNALSELTGTTTNMEGASRALGYLYDVAGNRTRLTYPDGNYVSLLRYDSGALYYASLNSSSMVFQPARDAAGRQSVLYRLNTTSGTWSGTRITVTRAITP